MGFMWGKQHWFNNKKSINVIHHINKVKKKKLYNHLNRCRKTFDKNPASITDKNNK